MNGESIIIESKHPLTRQVEGVNNIGYLQVEKIEETVFENRFHHVPELIKMGANIKVEHNKAHYYWGSTFVWSKCGCC